MYDYAKSQQGQGGDEAGGDGAEAVGATGAVDDPGGGVTVFAPPRRSKIRQSDRTDPSVSTQKAMMKGVIPVTRQSATAKLLKSFALIVKPPNSTECPMMWSTSK